ncbi:MAG: methyltransferase domain-containing protein [Bacteroidetes bacterium]|nr:MAG: methyltransferase domain-containing protein [Bacteroidota bacterium]
MSEQFTQAISRRYDELSGQECCLSCGGAINYADIQPGFQCADLGSGKGFDVLKMATIAGPEGFAWGVDVSDAMMDTARENAQKLKLANVAFIKSELENIQLDTETLDLVLSNCTLNHSLDQGAVWKEIFRILKYGGCFVVSDIFSLEKVSDKFRNDPEAVAQCWAGAVTKEEYFNNLKTAGFDAVEIIEESKPYQKGEIHVCSFTIKGFKTKNN